MRLNTDETYIEDRRKEKLKSSYASQSMKFDNLLSGIGQKPPIIQHTTLQNLYPQFQPSRTSENLLLRIDEPTRVFSQLNDVGCIRHLGSVPKLEKGVIHKEKANRQTDVASILEGFYLNRLSVTNRTPYLLRKANTGITGFFGGLFKTVAGVFSLSLLTTLTGSALIPFIGVPLLCGWLTENGSKELSKWVDEVQPGYCNVHTDIERAFLVAQLAGQLQEARRHNAALEEDMGRFLHKINAFQSLITATAQDKSLQGTLFDRLCIEVGQQRDTLRHLLTSDLAKARTIINTGGGAYIGGNLIVGHDFIGRDYKVNRVTRLDWMSSYAGASSLQARPVADPNVQADTINTEGGAYINGNADVISNFIGRDHL